MTDKGFVYICKHLPRLLSLGVEGCQITDRGLSEGALELGNLEELDLGSKLITDAGVVTMVKYLIGLTDLTLVCCLSITEACIEAILNRLPSLTHLGIEGCVQITDQAIDRLRDNAVAAVSFF